MGWKRATCESVTCQAYIPHASTKAVQCLKYIVTIVNNSTLNKHFRTFSADLHIHAFIGLRKQHEL